MRSNEQWLEVLGSQTKNQDHALADLRVLLIRGLRPALKGWVRTWGREFDQQAEDFAQEALMIILKNLSTFNNLSRFITWAYKICIRVALTELRRKRWLDVSLDSLMEEDKPEAWESRYPAPETKVNNEMSMAWIKKIMIEVLSPKQLTALGLVAFKGLPLEEAARRLDTNRNALYKLLHDARIKLKQRIDRQGLTVHDLTESG